MENQLGGRVGEGKQKHKTRSKRKIIIYQEWADRFNVNILTIRSYVAKYIAGGKVYDPYDIFSVLDFNDYLAEIKQNKINALNGIKTPEKTERPPPHG
jgi:hypothetical protein